MIYKFLLVCTLLATFVSGSDVVELYDSTFDKAVMAPDAGVWFLRFYAPWCGHCKALKPTWEQAAEELKGQVHFGDVDATEEFGLAHRFNIRSYPTVILIAFGKYYSFDGSRTLESIKDFALNLYPHKEAHAVPRMPFFLTILYQKYSNKANMYLYTHPLFTSILLVAIGLTFGVCFTLLMLEVFYYNRLYDEEEEEEEEDTEEKTAQSTEQEEEVEEKTEESTEKVEGTETSEN
ncbi:hypothetical protein WA171_004833, partial [Blastocystis sp. BT1]